MKKVLNGVVIAFSVAIVCVSVFAVGINMVFPFAYKKEIAACGNKYGLDNGLLASIIFCESRFNKNAVSKKGAIGLMQIMPTTAKSFAFDNENFDESELFDPQTNIEIGARLIRYLFDKYYNENIVLACYNAGEGAARAWIKNGELDEDSITFGETKAYIKKVQKMKKYYKLNF